MSLPKCFLLFIISLANIALAIDCHLPKDEGINCNNNPVTIKFYFDIRTNICQPLFYRGCAGNENRFDSRELCTKICVPSKPKKRQDDDDDDGDSDSDEESGESVKKSGIKQDMSLTVNVCKIPTDAKIRDKITKCDHGCPIGYKCNKNNYCCPLKETICNLPASSGTEREAFKHYGRYAYTPGLNNCIRFSYFGLGGNFNNFVTYAQCRKYCMKGKQ